MWRSVFVPTVVLAFAEGLLVPVLPLFVASLGVPFWWVGLVLAGEAIGMLVGDLPAGALLRRVDRKTAMLLGIALLGVAALGAAFVDAVVAIFALRVLAGLGAALWGISRHAFLTDAVPLHRRGRMIAAFGGAQRIGSLAGPAVGGVVAALGGFSAAFLLYAAVAGLTLAYCWRYLESAPPVGRRVLARARPGVTAHTAPPRDGSDEPASPWASVWALGWRRLGAAAAGVLMAQAIRAGRRIVIPLYAASALGLDVQQVGWIVSLAAAFDVVLFPLAGWVMDRYGRKWAIVPSFALQAVGMALVPLAAGFAGLAVVASLIGLGNGLGSGSMMTVGADLAPKGAVGEFLGAWRLVGDGGAMGGPVLVGALADALGLAFATLAVAAVGAGAALTFAYGVPETVRRGS
ncbi:MAG: MFS transporter [Trueperaceae bacterium]|nr:MFS transporter [Trueperaceae bacterium]